ncbi:MAG: MBL fold metallo-hydrolase [Acidobacteria bacterium]|nr:MBL fold metallo-hydrolase [Acidobacteriota bacterium]
MVQVTVLGSGSAGNATLVRSSQARVLVDLGLTGKDAAARLSQVGCDPTHLDAILLSHEHGDHVRGVAAFAKAFPRTVVYATEGTSLASNLRGNVRAEEAIRPGERLRIGDIQVTPFTIPHDATDPLAFTLEVEGVKVGIVMDLGHFSSTVKECLRRCDVLVLESNHDMEMLKVGPYPWALKQRLLSRVGHLSNEAVAEFLGSDFDGYARTIFLAHLSKTNNHPEIARLSAQKALASRAPLFAALEKSHAELKLTYQDRPGETVTL